MRTERQRVRPGEVLDVGSRCTESFIDLTGAWKNPRPDTCERRDCTEARGSRGHRIRDSAATGVPRSVQGSIRLRLHAILAAHEESKRRGAATPGRATNGYI